MPLRKSVINKRGNYFRDPDFQSHATGQMSDDVYGQVLDNICIACCDIIVVNPAGEILLGKRAWEPLADWWIQGGRMKPGESFEEACARNAKRELGLTIDPERFEEMRSYIHNWGKRRQEPSDHGSCTASIVHVLYLTKEECGQIKHNEEYIGVQWSKPSKIYGNPEFCELLQQVAYDFAVYDFLPVLPWRKLGSRFQRNVSNSGKGD